MHECERLLFRDDQMQGSILMATLNDPGNFDAPEHRSLRVAGADSVCFEQFPDRQMLLAKAKGLYFRELIGEDGPPAAAGRLGLKIKRHFEFGKRRRVFRAKQRSILVHRRFHGQR